MRAVIVAEILASQKAGHVWTPYRPFLDLEESLGAMRCGRCKKPSAYVSYCGGLGRTVLCETHYQQEIAQSAAA